MESKPTSDIRIGSEEIRLDAGTETRKNTNRFQTQARLTPPEYTAKETEKDARAIDEVMGGAKDNI